jgi:hypothetical protein
MSEEPPDPPPSEPAGKPPLLDYPSVPTEPEPETEGWGEIARAMAVVFGFIGLLLFAYFGVCGMMLRGC